MTKKRTGLKRILFWYFWRFGHHWREDKTLGYDGVFAGVAVFGFLIYAIYLLSIIISHNPILFGVWFLIIVLFLICFWLFAKGLILLTDWLNKI